MFSVEEDEYYRAYTRCAESLSLVCRPWRAIVDDLRLQAIHIDPSTEIEGQTLSNVGRVILDLSDDQYSGSQTAFTLLEKRIGFRKLALLDIFGDPAANDVFPSLFAYADQLCNLRYLWISWMLENPSPIPLDLFSSSFPSLQSLHLFGPLPPETPPLCLSNLEVLTINPVDEHMKTNFNGWNLPALLYLSLEKDQDSDQVVVLYLRHLARILSTIRALRLSSSLHIQGEIGTLSPRLEQLFVRQTTFISEFPTSSLHPLERMTIEGPLGGNVNSPFEGIPSWIKVEILVLEWQRSDLTHQPQENIGGVYTRANLIHIALTSGFKCVDVQGLTFDEWKRGQGDSSAD